MKKFLAILFIVLWAACQFGCGSSRKIEKAKKTFDNYEQAAAEYCATKFPVKESVRFLPGDTITNTVTETKVELVDVDCPPSEKGTTIKTEVKYKDRTITKFVHDTVEITKENTAEIRSLNGKLQAANDNVQEQAKEAEKWKKKAQSRGKENWSWRGVALLALACFTRKLWLPAGARLFGVLSKLVGK
jgi:hypothetical protein